MTTGPTTTTMIGRARAVRAVADAIADRTDFVISVPPDAVTSVLARLAVLPRVWTAYVDTGQPVVLATGDPAAAMLLGLVGDVVAVIVVPKTVPAEQLSAALNQPVTADGTRDLVIIRSEDRGPTCWPLIFVEAIERVDPAAAAQIAASDIRRMS